MGNGLCGDTNNSEEQRSDFGTNGWWRYVLDGLMRLHMPGMQGDAGIATCIRDALLYGCAEFGTVSGIIPKLPRIVIFRSILLNLYRSHVLHTMNNHILHPLLMKKLGH